MDRVEFFGGALFIPAFLVSVGLLIDPTVLADPRTWQLAIVFAISLVLGKGGAALRDRPDPPVQPPAGRGRPSPCRCPQAAATLAATTVGASVGLFGRRRRQRRRRRHRVQPVHLVGARDARRRPDRAAGPRRSAAGVGDRGRDRGRRHGPPARRRSSPGSRSGTAGSWCRPTSSPTARTVRWTRRRATAREIDEAVRRAGIEADPSLRVAQSVRQGVRNEIHEHDGVAARHRAPRRDPRAGLPVRRPVRGDRRGVAGPGHGRRDGRRAGQAGAAAAPAPTTSRASRRSETGLAVEVAPPARRVRAGARRRAAGRRHRCRTTLPGARERPARAAGAGSRPLDPGDGPGRATSSLLPGDRATLVFGRDAARVAAMPGVSVAVVVGPFTSTGFPVTSPVGTIVAGNTAPI